MEDGGLSNNLLDGYFSTSSGISERIQERRTLSQKLESDKEFREKYIAENNNIPIIKNSELQNDDLENVEDLIHRLNTSGIPEAGITVINEDENFTTVCDKELEKINNQKIVINIYGSNVKIYNVKK